MFFELSPKGMHIFWVSAWYGAVEDGGGRPGLASLWLAVDLSPTETVPLQNRVIGQDVSVAPSGSESL